MIFFRRVVGNSMHPTLREGQIVAAHMMRNFKVGQVVIAFIDTREVVKRIAKIENNGRIYLQGDNESESTDSREYGYISDSKIEGVVFWPSVKINKAKTNIN